MLTTAEKLLDNDRGSFGADSGMVPLKVVVRLNPLELGIFYKKNKTSTKKKLYLVELKNLLLLENSDKITETIYKQHSKIFDKKKIPYEQIFNIINKMLEYIKNELLENEVENDFSENEYKKFIKK